MINGIEIKNFKMFEELSIKRLAPVTLVGGMNNVGKSSLLEGVFVATSPLATNPFVKILGRRKFLEAKNSPDGLWMPFFRNFRGENEIEFCLYPSARWKKERVKISYSEVTDFVPQNEGVPKIKERVQISYSKVPDDSHFVPQNGDFLKIDESIPTAKYVLRKNTTLSGNDGDIVEETEHVAISDGIILPQKNRISPYSGHVVTMIGADCARPNDVSGLVSEIDKKNSIEELVNFLKMVEPSLTDISVGIHGSENAVFFGCGFDEKINASLSGEGTLRLLSIASMILAAKPEILLIDEVENGLHYSVQPKFWEALSFLGNKKNVQIIAATHSRECIEAAVKGMKANNLENDFAFVRLQRNKKDADKISAVEMTAEDVERMSEREWEIR